MATPADDPIKITRDSPARIRLCLAGATVIVSNAEAATITDRITLLLGYAHTLLQLDDFLRESIQEVAESIASYDYEEGSLNLHDSYNLENDSASQEAYEAVYRYLRG